MMQYIHQNFRQNLTLEDIAGQAMVSKSTALNLFRRYLHDTPVHYLVKYRLQEAAKLLATTEKKITVISGETGFENMDYFAKHLRNIMGGHQRNIEEKNKWIRMTENGSFKM